MVETKGRYKFECSGREFEDAGYIGISSNLKIATGYDNKIEVKPPISEDYGIGSDEMTIEEKKELSLYMIGLWLNFAK